MIGNLTKTKANRILGLDVSTNSAAYCLLVNGVVKECGEIKFDGASVFERLADGQAKVAVLKKLKPDLIIFESAVFVQNKKTVVLLAYSFGAIVGALMVPGAKIEEIPPITWLAHIKNKTSLAEKAAFKEAHPERKKSWYDNEFRKIRKGKTMAWVKDNMGVDTDNDNIADACAIARYGYDKFAR